MTLSETETRNRSTKVQSKLERGTRENENENNPKIVERGMESGEEWIAADAGGLGHHVGCGGWRLATPGACVLSAQCGREAGTR